MKITSSAFSDGALIPIKYTCDGDDISPPLVWSDIPENTASFVLINDDPDAPVGTWDHWILFNLEGKTTELAENVDLSKLAGVQLGRNSWRRNDYGGPCPPYGTHRYFFKLYALDMKLDLPAGSSKQDIKKAMAGHILAEAELLGRYKRP
ncbi:MAG TPA: YbhB/YbcL family Raf kinase inhibitor-like protein [Candidatus Marinimicrobia bacterium]|nr:YbhB/YbcL family Raf kinase inhibitor-like protein [Candidatus Neomarinimicrobiota bacterium]